MYSKQYDAPPPSYSVTWTQLHVIGMTKTGKFEKSKTTAGITELKYKVKGSE